MKPTLSSILTPLLNSIGAKDNGYGGFTVQTKLGPMNLIPFDDWVACRFDDVEKAKAHFGISNIGQGRLNPFSGKWNWHAWDVCPHGYQPRGGVYPKTVLKTLAETVWREVENLSIKEAV